MTLLTSKIASIGSGRKYFSVNIYNGVGQEFWGCYLSWLTVWLSLSISDKLVTMLATTALHGRQAGDHWSCPCLSIRLGTLCLQPDTEKIDAFKSSGADRGNMKEGPHSYVSYLQIKAFLIV